MRQLLIILAAIALGSHCLNGIMMGRHRKPGAEGWREGLDWAPGNLIFHPELLTRRGIHFRRWAVISFIVWWAAILFAIALRFHLA